jgi:ligand-binding sensor domain-containing protein
MRLLFLFFYLSNIICQEQTRFQKLGSDEGLDQHILYTTYQDKKGFLYLGGEYAFTVYDGLEFKSYKYNPKDTNGLSYFYINAMTEAKDNTIWIGTGNGLSQFNPVKKSFNRFYFKELKKNNEELFVHSLICDSANNLWASLDKIILKITLLEILPKLIFFIMVLNHFL